MAQKINKIYVGENSMAIPVYPPLPPVNIVGSAYDAASSTSFASISVDAMAWASAISVTAPPVNTYLGVAYGADKFIILPYTAARDAYYSSDGVVWRSTPMPFNTWWRGIDYGNGHFFAVSSNNGSTSITTYIAKSVDGITWTYNVAPISADWYAIKYGKTSVSGSLGVWVLTSVNGYVYTSVNDGATWTQAMHVGAVYAPIIGPDKIVVIQGSNSASYPGNVGRYSTDDGVTWTQFTVPSYHAGMGGTYANGVYISTGENVILYSIDGVTWSTATTTITESLWAVTYINGLFVAATYYVWTSSDGVSWVNRGTLPKSSRMLAVRV